jgi:hypothetical protein
MTNRQDFLERVLDRQIKDLRAELARVEAERDALLAEAFAFSEKVRELTDALDAARGTVGKP